MILWQFMIVVAIWWTANTLTSVVSKSIMREVSETYEGATGWTTAFKDLRWLDLTVLQHLIGTIGSVAWLKAIMNQPLLPEEIPRKSIYMAAVGNVVGNLATNAAYALISSSTTQMIKACEPIFTFGLSFLLLQNHDALSFPTLLSIVTMIIGACMFVMWETSFNIWGIIAAISSNIAFPLRNISVKKLSHVWSCPLQKYAIISAYSVLILLPAIIIRFANTQQLFPVSRRENLVSSLTHLTYNVASINVLQSVSPLSHAILNLSKRVLVIFVNISYFQTLLTVSMSIGLLVFFFGLFWYYKITSGSTSSKSVLSKGTLILLASLLITACIYSLFNSKDYREKARHTRSMSVHISSAWVFERQLPLTVIDNIVSLSQHQFVHVYCGTAQCVDAITELDEMSITAEFLVIPDIVRGTPLEQWVVQHPLNKVFSGNEFESHLKTVVQLGILWHYGGFFVDPILKITGDLFPPTDSITWISKGTDGGESLDVSYFPKKHPFIHNLMRLFVDEYSKRSHQLNFSETVRDAYASCVLASNCPLCVTMLHLESLDIDENESEKHHYGTLSYNSRVQEVNAANLGDEIQGFPGLQFVPFVDNFAERDALSTSASNQKVTTFFNAWWGSRQSDWPPPDNIEPIMVSVHIHSSVQDEWAKHIDYFRSRAPIGCRDYSTLDYLKKHGVEAYFSGCLTLLIKEPSLGKNRTDMIYLVDVKKEYIDMLPEDVLERAIIIHHNMEGRRRQNSLERFAAAYQLLEKYALAKMVITQRIHSALPCVAMGTPVIFINSPQLPGGGGTDKESSERTSGLLPLFHSLDLYSLSSAEAMDYLRNFPWESPPPNPNIDLMMRLRATAWNVIRQYQAFYDTAKRFDLLPMSPPSTSVGASHPLFHLIIATSNYTMKMFDHSCVTCDLQEVVQWRSIESIFHHHPLAKVIVHSNTLMQSDFAVLTEAGYSIEVQRYDLLKLLEHTPAHSLLDAVKAPYYFHELARDVLKIVILYVFGGIYMDTNIILVRPVDSIGTNVLVWQDPRSMALSKSFMKFSKRSRYLKTYLERIDIMLYSNRSLDIFIKAFSDSFEDVQILSNLAFHTFNTIDHMKQNYNYQQTAYGVQLCSQGKHDNIVRLEEKIPFKHVLNSYCVLCNKQY